MAVKKNIIKVHTHTNNPSFLYIVLNLKQKEERNKKYKFCKKNLSGKKQAKFFPHVRLGLIYTQNRIILNRITCGKRKIST